MMLCKQCILPESYPGITLGDDGICNLCRDFRNGNGKPENPHFRDPEELKGALDQYRNNDGAYDVIMPLSGGVDSSFALIEVVEKYNLRPLAFHNDHGYEHETAAYNVRQLCKALNVDLVILQTDYTFMKKLWKHVNNSKVKGLSGCYVCGNILYANALSIAEKYKIPLIINGYSKGQVATIENRHSGLAWMGDFIQEISDRNDYLFVEEFIKKMSPQKKQKIYLSRNDLEGPIEFKKILVIPFYIFKFYKTRKEDLKKICRERFDWKDSEHSYPKRTTNCMMNWLNNYYDMKKMGCSNYHAEYSTLIREGEISREQALKDLEFDPPDGLLPRLAAEIGIDFKEE